MKLIVMKEDVKDQVVKRAIKALDKQFPGMTVKEVEKHQLQEAIEEARKELYVDKEGLWFIVYQN